MFDIGGWEVLVIAALALIVVGPKDLPRLIRAAGQWVGRARKMAQDFQRGMDNAAREADLAEEADTLRNVGSTLKGGMKTPSVKSMLEDQSGMRAASAARPAAPAKTGAVSAGSGGAGATASASSASGASAAAKTAPKSAAASGDDAVLRDFERGVRGE